MQFSAREPFQRVQRAGKHSVDLIRTVQPGHPGSSTPWAPGMLAQMKGVLARNQLFPGASAALVDRKVVEPFEKGAMDAFEPAPAAVDTLPHCRPLYRNCEARTIEVLTPIERF